MVGLLMRPKLQGPGFCTFCHCNFKRKTKTHERTRTEYTFRRGGISIVITEDYPRSKATRADSPTTKTFVGLSPQRVFLPPAERQFGMSTRLWIQK